ncbi:unnamed protein product [Mytilus edulis]|uniref:Fibronectin type-III domain-containing protein n=1 Tax=Mytilus edulis TaxID=6550 RepID=A0A8S3V1X9_MYTED|nr:unnamed protein product [Mytilus edulis]
MSDTSITIRWKFVYKGTNEWTSEETNIPRGSVEFTVRNLQPDTCYEIKINSTNQNGKSKFSTTLDQRTLRAAPKGFDIPKWSNRSITVSWNIDDVEHSLTYELMYGIKGLNDLTVLLISTEDILKDENGRFSYKIENLQPEKSYEVKICSVDNLVKSQCTEYKTQHTRNVDEDDGQTIGIDNAATYTNDTGKGMVSPGHIDEIDTHSYGKKIDRSYVDFWFDTIHCLRTVDLPVDANINYPIDPPVIIVFTGTDKYNDQAKLDQRKSELQQQLNSVLDVVTNTITYETFSFIQQRRF